MNTKLKLEKTKYGTHVVLPNRWVTQEELVELESQLEMVREERKSKIPALDQKIAILENKLKRLQEKKAQLEDTARIAGISGTDDLRNFGWKALGHFIGMPYVEYLVDDNHVVAGFKDCEGKVPIIHEVDPRKSYLCHDCRTGFSTAKKLADHQFHVRIGREKCIPFKEKEALNEDAKQEDPRN